MHDAAAKTDPTKPAPGDRFERLRELAFTMLLLTVMGTGAWISTLYKLQFDWTWRHRSSLTEASMRVLQALDDPVQVRAFARDDDVARARIGRLVSRYQRHKPDLTLEFINPDLRPDLTRKLGIRVSGELVLTYQARDEHLRELSERTFSSALYRLGTQDRQPLLFIRGHGERSPDGAANFDLGEFAAALRDQGLSVGTLDPAVAVATPDTDTVLVLAGPKTALLEGEVAFIEAHLERGGNLLWLLDPTMSSSLRPLLDLLDLELLPGVVVDATTRMFGIDDPAFALVTRYPSHPVTTDLEAVTLFPRAAGLESRSDERWQVQPLLRTLERSWTETGAVGGKISYDEGTGERPGPIDIGLALTRERPQGLGEQRVLVIGDGDFLANSHLGNGGNLALGLNMVNWLVSDDSGSPVIHLQAAPDQQLQLSDRTLGTLSLLELVILPAVMAMLGFLLLLRRRRAQRPGSKR
jgi:ABC-type uncharacterized transport system involved in gliding motility auxiliary subunit